MDAALIQQVWQRAQHCCEYCRMPQDHDDTTFEIDHIIARKHGGPTVARNLALSCFWCNSFKGSDLGGLDPHTRKLTPLFNPRRHKWSRHFRWDGPFLRGRTPIGRVTIAVLHINDPFRVELREGLIEEGLFPPSP
ncbi:MAG TPA: HNH endonuclease signature motif containing protein [Gemmataceae bacterium]|nr:HNH endonuclease signature motif containing protein [Gemmataceae bacterium]